MQEILKKVNELVQILETRLVEVTKKAEDNDKQVNRLSDQQTTIDNRSADLDKREQAIRPIEDVVALKNEASELHTKAQSLMREANEKIRAFETHQKVIEAEKDENNRNLIAREGAIQKREQVLAEAEAKLAEDIKNYKDKVVEEVRKKLG